MANRVDSAAHCAVLAAIHARLPMPTPDDQRAAQLETARADARFWPGFAVLRHTRGMARLALEDVELQTGVLRIRTSKFHKSRLVPLSPTANDALRAYLRQRLAAPFVPIRVQRCCAGGATVVMDTRVLAWVRPSTACWSPPTCWTPKAGDHVSTI
jgi:hypothetical protein